MKEQVIYEQVSNYFYPFFNEILCGFRKAHRTQHVLVLNYLLLDLFFIYYYFLYY